MPHLSKTTNVETALQFAFIQRMTIAHERSIRAVDGLDQETLCTEPITGDWTIKDTLGHVVTWNDEFRLAIRIILKRDSLQPLQPSQQVMDFDEWTKLKVAEKHRWPWRRIRADLDRDYADAIRLIMSIRPGEFRKRGVTPWVYSPPKEMEKFIHGKIESVETLLTYHWRHRNQHSRMIEKWREENR